MATVCVYVAAGAICWYIPTHTVHFQRQMGTSDRAFYVTYARRSASSQLWDDRVGNNLTDAIQRCIIIYLYIYLILSLSFTVGRPIRFFLDVI